MAIALTFFAPPRGDVGAHSCLTGCALDGFLYKEINYIATRECWENERFT